MHVALICTVLYIGCAGDGRAVPSLIGLLGHGCQQMLAPGEVVKDMAIADFYTAIITDCGRVYWW